MNQENSKAFISFVEILKQATVAMINAGKILEVKTNFRRRT